MEQEPSTEDIIKELALESLINRVLERRLSLEEALDLWGKLEEIIRV